MGRPRNACLSIRVRQAKIAGDSRPAARLTLNTKITAISPKLYLGRSERRIDRSWTRKFSVGHTGVKQAKPAISAGGGLHPSLTAIGKPCNLPYSSLGSMFKGRGDFLAQIHADFRRERNQTKTKVICQAIHGWGGIGKSRAVVEYAWRYEAEYTALFFVDAKTPED